MAIVFLVDMNTIEIALVVAALFVVLRMKRGGGWRFPRLEALVRYLDNRPWTAVVLVGLSAVVLRLALLPVMPVPVPVITDEFSHLLLADTLASGRLTNPPHPMWQHFESIHIIQQPTYNSMYFPGAALFLAAGEVLGNPWIGVLIGCGLMCAALTWMLQGWLPRRWALAGGVIAVVRYGVFSYWMNSYWGASVAAMAGALVLGALPRIRRRPAVGLALALGVGLALLALTRPYEGLALSLPAAVYLFWGPIRGGFQAWKRFLPRVAAPIMLVLVLAGAGIGYYDYRVTGDPAVPPYQINQEMYGWPTTLPIFEAGDHTFRHKQMAEYYAWERGLHESLMHPIQNAWDMVFKMIPLWSFFLGPVLTVPLIFGRKFIRDRRIRFLVWTAGFMLLAVAAEQSSYPHYMTPATAVWLALVVQAVRHTWHYRKGDYAAGRGLVTALAGVVAAIAVFSVVNRATGDPYAPTFGYYISNCCSEPGNLARADIQAKLEAMPGKDLVIVRYGPEHEFIYEWVYNRADIDGSEVVWARDMGGQSNQELIDYYPDRNHWLLEPDGDELVLEPYPDEPPSTISAVQAYSIGGAGH